METGASSAPLEVAVRSEDDDEDPFGPLNEREATSEVTIKQEDIPAEAHHVNQLTLGSGVVRPTHETWLVHGITFCGKCGAWASSAPRLLTKAWPKEPGKRANDLSRLSAGKEPNRRTAWPGDTPLVRRNVPRG